MDFLFDRIASGRTLKCLAIVDDATHESVCVVVEHSMGGNHLTRVLDQICSMRGRPGVIRTDNVLRTKASYFACNSHPACNNLVIAPIDLRAPRVSPTVFR